MKTNNNTLKILISGFFIAVFSVVPLLTVQPERAEAAYDGGRIIDNDVFLHSSSMTKGQIQGFLESKNSGIATKKYELSCYGSTSQERQWYTSAGATCDKDVPASEIIYYAARIYGINPRVILATLQKEQSLITTQNPTSWQISQAMGYGCPTSGSCSSESNFAYQIDSGTWVLRYHYERANGNMNWWKPSSSWTCGTEKNFYKPNLYPGQNVSFYDQNNVKYRTHYINNAATSSLYCYTPHAYNNPEGLYGRAAYGTKGLYYSGSYNFVYWFENWFESTQSSWSSWSKTGGGAVWSTDSAPNLSFGPNGDFILTAITENGTLRVKRGVFGGTWGDWVTHGHGDGSSWTSATAGFNDKSKKPRLFAINRLGQMYYRYQTGAGWSSWSKTGGGAVWSTDSAPNLSFGPNGDFILTAITENGTLRVKRGVFGGTWGDWVTHGHGDGSSWTSATAGFNDKSKKPRLFAINRLGQMYYRYQTGAGWSSWSKTGGGAVWSTDSAPNLSFGPNGDFILTAITENGTLRVKRGVFGGTWGDWVDQPDYDNWTSATAGFNDKSKKPRLFSIDKTGQMYYRYQSK